MAACSSDPPTISYPDWLAAASRVLDLQAEHAAALFSLFETLSLPDSTAQLALARTEAAALAAGEPTLTTYRNARAVTAPPFFCFLILQLFAASRAARTPAPDSLPARVSSPSAGAHPGGAVSLPSALGGGPSGLSPTRQLAVAIRAGDSEEYLTFVRRMLPDLLTICAGGGGASKISLAQCAHLAFFLAEGGSVSAESPSFGKQLPFLANWPGLGSKAAGARAGAAADKADVAMIQSFISPRLAPNVVVYPPVEIPRPTSAASPLVRGSGVSWPVDARAAPPGGAPAGGARPGGVVSVSGLVRALFVRVGAVEGGPPRLVRVYCCTLSTLYLLLPLQHVVVFGCTGCTVVVGAGAKTVTVEHCDRVRIVAATRHVRCSSSTDTRLYLACNAAPLIGPACRGVEVAPLSLTYPALESHLFAAGLTPFANRWSDAVVVGAPATPTPSPSAGTQPPTIVGSDVLLPPANFATMAVPIVMQGPTVASPFALPPAYAAVVRRRAAMATVLVRALRKVATQKAAGGGEGEIMSEVQRRFREWLAASGNLRQVLDLLHLDGLAAIAALPPPPAVPPMTPRPTR